MGVERGSAVPEHGLFEFLAASRPQRGWREGAAASAASVAGHAAIVGGVMLATLLSSRIGSSVPPSLVEKLEVVELRSVRLTSANGTEAASARVAAKGAPAPLERGVGDRRLAKLLPPTFVPEDIPLPTMAVLASLVVSEYDGIGQDSMLSAAVIFADHHEHTADELAAGPPSFGSTPYTQAPELANGPEMKKMLTRRYPPSLRDEGVGGRVLIWFLVDEFGHARKWLLKESSGHKALDKAALNMASLAKFRPAMNYDRRVPVWVVLPVTFMVMDNS